MEILYLFIYSCIHIFMYLLMIKMQLFSLLLRQFIIFGFNNIYVLICVLTYTQYIYIVHEIVYSTCTYNACFTGLYLEYL